MVTAIVVLAVALGLSLYWAWIFKLLAAACAQMYFDRTETYPESERLKEIAKRIATARLHKK